jgi:hypothetical protein
MLSPATELAEEDDLGSADLLAVDREDWPRLVARLEALYGVGELQGLAAVKVWLTEHGRWVARDDIGTATGAAAAAGTAGTASYP